MPFDPYPSQADLQREADATDRDISDLMALRRLRKIVTEALARAGGIPELRHPHRAWDIADLTDALHDQLELIDDCAAMIQRVLVLDERQDA